MHRVMYFIVRADDAQEAVKMAQETFQKELIEERRTTFDYCKPMDSDSAVSGSARWSEFRGKPNAAAISDELGQEWVNEGLQFTKRHFAENLYGFIQHSLECLEESVETAPDALGEILELVGQTREEHHHGDGGELLLEEYPRTINALYRGGGMQRHFAGQLGRDNPTVAHVMDCYTYGHLSMVDGKVDIENVEELLEEQPDNAWVVPLDTHF